MLISGLAAFLGVTLSAGCHLTIEVQTENGGTPTGAAHTITAVIPTITPRANVTASASWTPAPTGSPVIASTAAPPTALTAASSAQTVTVNDSGDGVVGCPDRCTLRGALSVATAGDIIIFAPTVRGAIILSSALAITKDLSIVGPGANLLTLDANGKDLVFIITSPDSQVRISGLTLQNGHGDEAGGIVNRGTLTLSDCVLTGNTGTYAGAIYGESKSTLTLTGSTLWKNTGSDAGALGGYESTMSISNSTFSENTGAKGSALSIMGGQWLVLNSTITGNTTIQGAAGGIDINPSSYGSTTFAIGSTLVFGNTGGIPQISGKFQSLGANLFGANQPMNDADASDRQIDDIKLGLLALNAPGSTPTIALSAPNPAIGNGKCNLSIPVKTDQRGTPRKPSCDIGAFETQPDGTNPPVTAAASGALPITHVATWGRGWLDRAMWSPDGRLLAVGGALGIWLYARDDLQAGVANATPRLLKGHQGVVTALAFSPGSTILASGSSDHSIILWETATGRQKATLQPEPGWEIAGLVFSPNGSTLASSSSVIDQISLWDVKTGQIRQTLNGNATGYGPLAYSPDGRYLAAGTAVSSQKVVVWDTSTTKPAFTLEGLYGEVEHVAYSPDGKWLAAADMSYQVFVYDASTGQQVTRFKDVGVVYRFGFTPDNKMIVTAGVDGKIRLWNVAKAADPAGMLDGHLGRVDDVAISPDGTLLASVSRFDTLRLWQLGERRALGPAPAFGSAISSLALSPDGATLVTGDHAGFVRLVDPVTGAVRKTLDQQQGAITAVTISPDGKLLVASNDNYRLAVWEMASGKVIFAPDRFVHPPVDVKFSPDGKTLAVATTNSIAFYQASTFQPTTELTDIQPGSLAFSPDGQTLVVGDYETIDFYDVATAKLKLSVPKPKSENSRVTYDAAGAVIAISYIDHDIHLLDPQTGQDKRLLKNDIERYPQSLAFSPDGSILAAGIGSSAVFLWDVNTGAVLGRLEGYHAAVGSLAFSPDGHTLTTASDDGTIQIWQITR